MTPTRGLYLTVLFLLLALMPAPASAQTQAGPAYVTRVVDGVTLYAGVAGRIEVVRHLGVRVPRIDDPNYGNSPYAASAREANRRLALASQVLPRTGIAGQHIPARREILAQALETTQIPTRSATIISSALDKVRLLTDDDTLTRMEHALTRTAIESDPDFVTKMAKRWVDSIDQDGPEPSEEVLRQLQGAFFRRRRRHGLHHIEIFGTTTLRSADEDSVRMKILDQDVCAN